jgi:hypothetical protein
MELKDSLQRSWGPATGRYPEADASNPHIPTLFPYDTL